MDERGVSRAGDLLLGVSGDGCDVYTKAFYRELFEWEMEPIEQDGKLACMGTKSAGSSNGGIRPPTKQHGGATLYWLLCVTVPSGRRLL